MKSCWPFDSDYDAEDSRTMGDEDVETKLKLRAE
jgi:hypothetical protein